MNVTAKTRYLIRASFFHGNYDGQNTSLKFDIHLGGNYWDTVSLPDVSEVSVKEIMHVTPQNYTHVCVVNTGSGTPFISALELRPISEQAYYNDNIKPFESLSLVWRLDTGSDRDFELRYPYDVVDRRWLSCNVNQCTQITTMHPTSMSNISTLWAPSIVMSTANTPLNENEPLSFSWTAPDRTTNYYFYFHFSELKELMADESRAFNLTINDDYHHVTVVPRYLHPDVIYNMYSLSGSMEYKVSLNKIENGSTLPPILNALEVYSVLDLSQRETDQEDVDGINNLKSSYGVNKRDWDGDPCVPRPYLWTGLNCSYDGIEIPRIISLNLSSSGFWGEISEHLSKFSMIESEIVISTILM